MFSYIMKNTIAFKRMVIAAVVCAFMAIAFTSCHRGSGCPGRITYQHEIAQQPETDC